MSIWLAMLFSFSQMEVIVVTDLSIKFSYEIVADETLRLRNKDKYTLPNLIVAVKSRFPLL
jgi:hypothetical protein